MLDSIINSVTRTYRNGTRNSDQYVAGEVADYIVSNYDADWQTVYNKAREVLA